MKLNQEDQAAFDAMVADPEVGPMPETKGLVGSSLAEAMKARGEWHKKVKEYENAHNVKIKIPNGNGNGGQDAGVKEVSHIAQAEVQGGVDPGRERLKDHAGASHKCDIEARQKRDRKLTEEAQRKQKEGEAMKLKHPDGRKHELGEKLGGDVSGARGKLTLLNGSMDPRLRINVQSEGDVYGAVGGKIGRCRTKGDITNLSLGFGDESDLGGITATIPIEKAILTRMNMSGFGDLKKITEVETGGRVLEEAAIKTDVKKGFQPKNWRVVDQEFARVTSEVSPFLAHLDRVGIIAREEDTRETRQLVYARCLELAEGTKANIIATNNRLERMGVERRLGITLCPSDVVYIKGAFVTWSDGTQSPVVSHVQAWFDDLDCRSKEEKSWRYTLYVPPVPESEEEFWRRQYAESFSNYTALGMLGLVQQPSETRRQYCRRLLVSTDEELIERIKPEELTKRQFLKWVIQVRIISKVRHEWKDALGQTIVKGDDELTKDFENRVLAEGVYFCEIPVYEGCGEARLLWQRPLRKDKSEWEIGPDDIKQAAARGMVEWFAYDDNTLRPHPRFGLSDDRNAFDMFLALSPEEGQKYIERVQTAGQLALAHSSIDERSVDGVVIEQQDSTPDDHTDSAKKVEERKPKRWWGKG